MFFINPFILSPAGGDFESIATVTVGSGGASEIEFTSIPGTYQHLQVRLIGRGSAADVDIDTRYRVNADTGSNYAVHHLRGNGSAASAGGASSQDYMPLIGLPAANATASIFGASVIDILDYANTSKYKTLRQFAGEDRNGAGNVWVRSSLWMSTSAITSIKFYMTSGNFVQHSTAALYGVKAP
jgi:hypothetical protein